MSNLFFGRGRLAVWVLLALSILLVAAAACGDPSDMGIFVTMAQPGVTEDGVDYSVEDILGAIDGDPGEDGWAKAFDGSDNGLTPTHNISAFSFEETVSGLTPLEFDDIDTVLLSFAPNRVRVPGISGWVYGQDLIKFTETNINQIGPGEFEMFFDGSDVGLTTVDEKIDGVTWVTPETLTQWAGANDVEIPVDCNAGVLFLTTQGAYRVPGADGKPLRGKGSDVLLFCAFNTGANTAGLWYRVFKGSDVAMSPPNAPYSLVIASFTWDDDMLNANQADLDASVDFFFTARTTFTANGLTSPGQPSQLFRYNSDLNVVSDEGIDFNNDDQAAALNGVVDSLSMLPVITPP